MFLNQPSVFTDNLKKAIHIAEQKKEKCLFVFDIDSTLFCMKYRTQAIIRESSNDPVFCKEFPQHLNTVRQVEVTERDWSVEEIMSRYGFQEEEPMVLALKKIWKTKFFTNDYLDLDKPYKGCAEFIQHISQLGVQVYYLTARNRSNMHKGTIQSIKKWNFPLKNENRLIMKEISESDMSDAEYKIKYLKKLNQKSDTVVFFENEPVILNLAVQSIPQIHLFWINSTHSRQAQPPKSALPITMHYT